MARKVIKTRRDIPSVEELLQAPELTPEISALPRPVAAEIVKATVAAFKAELAQQRTAPELADLLTAVRQRLAEQVSRSLARVINATGIVVHTNLGRAPLPEHIFDEIRQTVVGYGNVEFDVATGSRGHRGDACERYLATLSGAESGTVVNNNAAALFAILNTLANRRKVLISRGELVQIGGGFRIPDILRKAGARLAEVGTTNITTVDDYEKAIDSQTALILKVHKSNFVQAGFTEEVPLKPLVALGRKRGVPVVNDLGSGVFISTSKILGYHEPTVQESVRAGAALTCFSGDKLLGGVQAGLIVGEAELISRIKKNPLFRTLRVDKLVFAVLEKLLAVYLDGSPLTGIKLWQILATDPAELHRRAEAILKKLGRPPGVAAVHTSAFVGGGALPERALKSAGLMFAETMPARRLMEAFRALRPPVIGRIDDDRFIIDLKAVDPADLDLLTDSIRRVLDSVSAEKQ